LPKITPKILGSVSSKKIGIITAVNWTSQKLQTSNISNTVQIKALIDSPNSAADITNIDMQSLSQECCTKIP